MPNSLRKTFAHLLHPRRSNNHRAALLHPEGYMVMVFLVCMFFGAAQWLPKVSPSAGYILGYATTITSDGVIAATNAQRAGSGLAPVQSNGQLTAAAVAKAQDMFQSQYWAHTSPSGKQPWDFIAGSGYKYQAAGENLARDFMHTGDMVGAWMDSPTHRANIMNGRYSEIGVAVVNGTLNGTETTLVVQMFGRPAQQAATNPAPVAQVTPTAATQPQQPAPPASAQPQQPDITSSPLPTTRPQQDQPIIQLAAAPSLTPDVDASAEPALTTDSESEQDVSVETISPTPKILADMSFFLGEIRPWPRISRLQLTKALIISAIVLIVTTLSYDVTIATRKQPMRSVGHAAGHMLFFTTILLLVLAFKAGGIQ